MAKGHLSEDTIKFIMTAETSELQQEIHKSGKAIDELKQKETNLRKEQAAVKSALGEESKEYKDLSVKIKKVTQEIADENLKLTELHKKLGTGSMTMAQLRKEAKNLQRQLDNTSQSLNPKEYEAYARKLQEVNQRMTELKATAQGITTQDNDGGGFLKRLIGSKLNLTQLKTFLAGGFIMKLGEVAMDFAGKAIDRIKDLVTESVNAAREAQGITHAFEQLNRTDVLDNLRKATHGTVSDLELMKAAVQAKDFRLPLDQLGKYLEFAQLKAQQTGQSVDYMVNSIVTGLGRKSLMILDNLGLSASEIKEEMEKTGDMATAVGNIIDRQMEAAGEHFETAAEREEQATTAVTNAQLELGKQMSDTFGIGEKSFTEMQSKAEVFILKGLTKLIIYCQDLYDKLTTVRIAVETVKVAFDTVFKACEIGFLWLIDTIKGVGRLTRDLAGLIESVFTGDFDKMGGAWDKFIVGIDTTVKEFAADGKDVGQRWGDNVIDSINKVMKGRKIETPKGENEIGEVVVTGKDRSKDKKKKTKSDNASKQDATAIADLKRQRQQELQIEQKNYEQIQRLWKEQLAKKAITQQEYDGIMLSLSMEHADCVLDIERQYAKESQKLTISDAQKKKELEQEQQRNIEKAENDAADARLKAFEQYQQQMEQLRQKGMSEADREKADRDAQLKVLEAYYKTALDYAKQDVEERLKVEEAYREALKKLKEEWDKKDEEKKFRTRSQLGLTTETEELARAKVAIAANTDLSASDRAAAEENLEREHQQRLLRIRQEYGIARRQEVYDMELEQLRAAKDQELLTEEEYAKAEFQLRVDQWKEQFDYYSKLFGDAFNALQDAELETVRAKYDAEIDAARKAGKDTTALEEKKANEELKVQKKYADVNFAIKLSQIVADTAVSIMKAYAELGPIAGSIAAALMGVTGAAQVAVAKAERDKIKRMTLSGSSSGGSAARVAIGRESGGYIDVDRAQDGRRYHAKYDPRRRGYVDQPTVIVGEGPAGQSKEWVASNAAVENPTIRPVIDAIDQAQRAGNVRTLDLQKVLLQQGRQQGGYIGGPVPAGTVPGGSAAGLSPRLMQRLTDVLERMEQEGIPALVGIDQVDAANELRNRSRRIAAK